MMRRHLDAALSFVISVLMVVSMVPTPALSAVAEGTSGGDAAVSGGDVSSESVKGEATSPAGSGDGAGNVSFDMDASLVGTPSEAVLEASPEKVRVRFSGGYDGCDDAVMSEFETVLDGAERALPACAFEREGFAFSGWSTTVDGRDVADDPVTEGVDESMRAISVPDSQALVDLRFLDADGHEADLGQCVRGGMLSLYAQWRALPRVTLAFDANGGTGDMAEIEAIANGNVWVLPACSLSRDGFSFVGWSVDGTDLTFADGAELADGDVTVLAERAKDGRITLRAVWEAKASGDTVPSGDKGDVARTDDSASGDAKSGNVSVGADVDGSVEVTVDARGGSGAQAGAVSEKVVDEGAGGEAAKAPDASRTVSSEAGSGKSEGEAVGDAAAGGAEGVSYAHRLIVRPKAGVGARAEDAVLGRSGDVLLLGFATKADMDAARTWYEPRCDLVAEDIALGASEGEGDVAQVSMDGNDNPFKALGEAEEAPALSRLGVTVALLDTGVPSGIASSVSMVSDDGTDRNGHASMMLEAMRGQNEHVRVMGVKVLDDAGHGTASSVYAGVMYAVDNGADVINMSFAGPDTEGNAAIAEAVRYALDHDVIVVAAAGNGGYDAGLVTPANVEGVFTVGAVEGGKVLVNSNRGSCVDVYVEATSTSVAAAKVSGQVSLGLDGWRERVVERLGVDVGEVLPGSNGALDGEGVGASADSTVYWGVSGTTLYLSASSGTNHTNSNALSQITSGDSVPWRSQRAYITGVVIDGAFAPTSTAYWFFGCDRLATFTNWSNLDVSNVTDMCSMFNGCSGAAFNPDVSSWDTSSVTNMSYMFFSCHGAAFNPDVSDWNTSSVTDMSDMFYNCSGAAFNPDVSSWDTSSVTIMNEMFRSCKGAVFNPNVSSWDTSSVTDMSYMFFYCYGAAFNPDVSDWNTSSVTNMYYMFYKCYGAAFTSLDVSDWDFTKITSTSKYLGLGGCSNLKELKVSASSKIASVSEHSAQGLYLSTWGNTDRGITGSTAANMVTTINAGNGAGTWEWELNVDDYALLDADGTLTFFKAAKGLASGTGVTVTDMDGTARTGRLYAVDLNGYSSGSQVPWYAQRTSIKAVRFAQVMKPVSTAYWFSGCSNLADFDSTNLDTVYVTDMSSMFEFCYNDVFNPDVSVWDTSNVTNMRCMFYYCAGAAFNPDVSSWDTSKVTNMGSMFYGCAGAVFNPNMSGWDTSSVINMEGMFSNCFGSVFNPDVSDWDTSNVRNMSYMFDECYGAVFNPDVSNWDTSNVTSMSYMFQMCYGIAFNPDVSNWDTSNVTNMNRMFYRCSGAAFTELDVSDWDFSKVTSTSNYLGLQNCTNLRKLTVSAGSKINTMFPEHEAQGLYVSTWRNTDRSITGSTAADMVTTINAGNGAGIWEWELNPLAGTAYAVLDSNGLLTFFRSTNTYIAGAGQTVTDIAGNSYTGEVYTGFETANPYSWYSSVPWSDQCSSIQSVAIANGQVIKPNGTAYWFYGCSNLASFSNAGNLDVSSVTSMSSMFQVCSDDAFNPDVSAWDTSNVTDMQHMFYHCSGDAFNPDVSAWNVSSVTNVNEMFYHCSGGAFNPDVSAWDTSSVTDMYGVFNDCSGAAFNPDVSSWITSGVTSMSYMFSGCSGSGFTELDVSGWDFSNITSTLNYLGLQGCTSLKQLTVSAGTKIHTNFPEHSAQGDYAATWKNDSQSITRSTAANMVTTINAGNGAGTWTWDLAGYTVKLRAPVGLGADDVVETVTATDDWSVPASPFTYARHDFVEWSGSDGETYAPGDVIEANTFSSGDTLIFTAVYEPHEYSGVNPQDNPDANGDGYGDNLAISMPASVSCVVKADGSTVWPSNVSVNNLSDVVVRLSSAKVDACDGFHLVSDIGSAVEENSVALLFGAGSATLDASSYATKAALPQGASWQAAAGGSVPIAFSADVSDVSADISQSVPFARVTWWAKVVD